MAQLDIRRARRLCVHEIGDQPVHIGRSSQNELALRNLHISRRHCVIERIDGQLRLRDLNSQGGTYLNGERITDAALFAGDRISLGPYDLVIRAEAGESALISRNSALDAALTHVHIDEDTGIPLEGPTALVETLKKQLSQEQQQRADALAQVAELHNRLEEFEQRAPATVARDDAADVSDESAADEDAITLVSPAAEAADDQRAAELAAAQNRIQEFEAQVRALEAEIERLHAAAESDSAASEAGVTTIAAAADSDEPLERESAEVARLQQLLLDAEQTASERLEAERQASREQIQKAEAELQSWRERSEASQKLLETEQAHAADLNRALEVSWKKIEQAETNVRALESRIENLESEHREQVAQADAALNEHMEQIESLTAREAAAQAELQSALAAQTGLEEIRSELQNRANAADASFREAFARAEELQQSNAQLHTKMDAMREQADAAASGSAARIAEQEQAIAALRASEEALKQRLNHLEATKFAASEKAERALRTLNLLNGQIASLDSQASQMDTLQERLAEIEEAWVDADETLETIDESDQEQLETAVEHRQQIIAELETLNKQRDAALVSLRESAMRLRSLAERETTPLLAAAAAGSGSAEGGARPSSAPPSENGSRKWWKRK